MRILRAGSTPQPQLAVQLAQQEDFDFGPRLLLVAVEPRRKYLRVVEYEQVLFVEVVEDVLEHAVLDRAFGAVDDHQPRFVAVVGRVAGQHLRGEVVAVLR